MDSKSQLNLVCQSDGVPAPMYSSFRSGGQDHVPLFTGKCEFNGKDFYAKGEYITKKSADSAVAKVVLSSLGGSSNGNSMYSSSKEGTSSSSQSSPSYNPSWSEG